MVIDMNEYKNIPKIRFKGFNDVWEQRKLNEVTDVRDGTHDSPKYIEFGHPFITSKNVKNGYINYDEIQYISDEDFNEINKRSKVDKNDILFGMIGTIGNIALIRENPDFAIKNVALIKDIKKIDYLYLYQYLQSNNIAKQFDENMDGGTQKFIALNKVRNLSIMYPTISEQIQIGGFLEKLDNLITLHQRKYEKLINVKKSLLEKMFPKNFSKLPEIRFKGFTDVWEQRKLGEVGYAKSGQGFPDAEQGGTRGIPFYKVSDMNITGNENELITANNYVTLEQINKNHWNIINDVPAIFFAKVGAAVMLNRKRLCRKSFLLDNNTMAYMFDKSKWNYNFGKTLFDTIDLTLLAQIGAIPSYNASDVENIEILMPHLKEQEKIGKLFTNLDNLITLHQRKLEKLSQIKKSLLDKMFV